jgi:uncharacterized protein (TIGR03086 family)
MSVDLPEVHARALAETRRFLAGVGADQWAAPSRCAEWDVRSLVNHVVAGNFWVAPLVGGQTIEQVGDRYDGDVLGDDPLSSYDRSAVEAAEAFGAPGAMDAPVAVSYGPVPGSIYAGHRFIDVLVHGWDIARSTGQYPALDPTLVDACWDVLDPQIDLLAGSGMFGTRIDLPADAPSQARLLGLLGRTD